ncbi:hypothetical protein N836_19005 [Leptolyngbya sp. Heron Island J]|uniref:nucleotidyltransferase domain-containing protein n=1 Tax=Leptolyngbya sp. Heron Island J TaxID=1385935 RepID=UPI0003B9A6F7|nr:nucleotidyltransferase family protein [Leptolyngbya sp. Heron Island J]ESA34080.1 hypothetical protein N836_19005 [Leptolyngbya sp. Heron Island J]
MNPFNTTILKPEISLLLHCVRWHLNASYQEQIQEQIQPLIDQLDWDKMLKMAQFHRLLPLLHKFLTSSSSIKLPDCVLQELRRRHLKNLGNNFSLVQELVSVLKILETEDIKAITFKGPITAISAYGDLSLRTFGDLDLLVHPDDFLRLREVAINHGYHCDRLMAAEERACLKKLSPEKQAAYFKSEKEFSLFNPKNRIFLDIHQGILSKQFAPLFDTRWVWDYTQTIKIGGRQVLGLKPEVQILILCAQGAEDYWNQLGKICDVAMLVHRHPELDWDALITLSKQLDVLPRLLLGLVLINHLYGVALPDEIQEMIKNSPSIQRLASTVQQDILLKNNCQPKSRLTIPRFIYQLRLMNNWKNQARSILAIMNPTLADLAAISLPKSLFFVYYLLRPFRLIQAGFGHQSER